MLGINNLDYLSQRDPRWATKMIGNSNITIGRMGCLITCLSMASQFCGCYMLPDEIASHNDWFEDASLIWINTDFKNMSFRWREGNQLKMVKNKPVNMDLIYAWLAHGDNRPFDHNRIAILQVANESHWVLGLWKVGDDILAIDPWTGETCLVLDKYNNITGAALFLKWNKDEHGGTQAFRVLGEPIAPNYN